MSEREPVRLGGQAICTLLRVFVRQWAAERADDEAVLRAGVRFRSAHCRVFRGASHKRDGEATAGAVRTLLRLGLLSRPHGYHTTHLALTAAGRCLAERSMCVLFGPHWRLLAPEVAVYHGQERVEVCGQQTWEQPEPAQPDRRPELTCLVCGARFRARTGRHRTCGPACARELRNQRRARRRAEKLANGDLGGDRSPGPDHPWREPHH